MADFIEITRILSGVESPITISKMYIISIYPYQDKTRIVINQNEHSKDGSSSYKTILNPLPYEKFILQYKILK